MKNLKGKKFIALLGLVLLLWCGMIGVALAANDVASGSKTGTWLTGQLSYSFTSTSDGTTGNGAKGTVTPDGSKLTVTATSSKSVTTGSGCNSSTTNAKETTTTVTVTNSSQYPLLVNSLSVDGTAEINGVKAGATINAGKTFTIKVTAEPNGTTDTASHEVTATITISVTPLTSVKITAAASPYVDYTLNGETVSKGGSDVTIETDLGIEISLPEITAPAGYELIGWHIGSKELTKASSFTADGNYTVYPVIVKEGTADGTYFKVGNTQYTFWEDAMDAAVNDSSKQVILVADYTLPDMMLDNAVLPSGGTYVKNDGSGHAVYLIPSGVTFIVPHAETYTYKTTGDHPYACETQVTSTTSTATAVGTSVFRELTVPSGALVSVSGVMAVGGTTTGVDQINGAHANVHLEAGAAIDVKSGGRLSSCGYIYGDGTVTAESGSYVYMPFSVLDFRGGGYTAGVAGKLNSQYGIDVPFPSGENGISPFTRYHMGAIQTRLVIEHGAELIGYVDLYANSAHNNANSTIIGSSDALITLKSGTVEITYDPNTYIQVATNFALGKTKIKIDGDAAFGHLTLTVDAIITTATVDTAKINFPIPYNFDIEIASGAFDVPNSVMLLPGASVIVDEGATLNVNSNLTVYDGLHDFTTGASNVKNVALEGYEAGSGAEKESPFSDTVSSGSNYPTTAALQGATFGGSGSADLIVNGTMNLNSGSSFGGVVQTSSSGAARIVVASSGVGTSTRTQIGAVGSWEYSIAFGLKSGQYGFAGATVRELQGQILDTGTGNRTDLFAGKTYQPAAGTDNISSYTYKLYYDSTRNNYVDLTDDVACILQGSWYNYEVDVYMILGEQSSGPVKMYFAHDAKLPEGYYYDAAKTKPATSVTDNQPLYFIGDAEAEIIRADGSASTTYPSVRNAVKDVHVGDTIVLLKDLTDFSSIIGAAAGQDFTFDMRGHSINYRSTPFTSAGGIMTVNMNGGKITNVVGEKHYDSPVVLMNHSQGSVTLNLNGGKISVTGTASAPLTNGGVENGGNLTIDLSGGTWEYKTGLAVPTSNAAANQHHDLTVMAAYQNKAMFNNAGTLTIKDTGGGGSVTTDLISNGATLTATTPTTNYVSVIRNQADATLYLDGGTFILDPSGDENGDAVLSTAATPVPMALYSAVVLNFGDIKSHETGSALSMQGFGSYLLYNFKDAMVDLDLRGGTLELNAIIVESDEFTISTTMYNGKAAIVNDGTMRLADSTGEGLLTTDISTTNSNAGNFINGVRNSPNAALPATLTLDGINIEVTQTLNAYSYGVYNGASGTINEITDSTITNMNGPALYAAGSAATATAERVVTKIGNITGSTFNAGTVGFNISHAQIGDLDHVTINAKGGNGITATNGCIIGSITDSEIASTAIGLSTASFAATATAPNSIAPQVGNVTRTTINAGTGGIYLNGQAANAYSTVPVAPAIGDLKNVTINAGTYSFSSNGAVGNSYNDYGGNALATVGVIEDCKFYSEKPAANTGVIVNANSSIEHILRTELIMTAPTVNTSYCIYNNGGQIEYIEDCTLDGNAGIYNRNTVSAAYNLAGGSGAVIAFYGKIGLIRDTDITVGQYAINNGGVIDEISGKCTFIAAPASAQVPRTSGTAALNGNTYGYTVYNSNQWWGTSAIWWRNDDASSGHMVRTDEYKMEDAFRPTIRKITGDVQIIALNTSTNNGHGVALYNAGVINEISGNTMIDTHVHPNTTAAITLSQYGIQNTTGGRIDLITDNVTISAGQNALSNGSQATAKQVTHYFEETATTINTQETWYRVGSEIKEISGNVKIEATVGTYGIANYREIGTISGNVSISAATTYALGNVFSAANHYNYLLQVRDSAATSYTQTKEYAFDQAHIGSIGRDVKIHSGGNYALYNHGKIDTLSAEISTDTQYAVATVSGHAETKKTEEQVNPGSGNNSGEKNIYCTYYTPTITTIDGAKITAGTSYGIKNVGIIDSITNTSVVTGTERAISNDAVHTVREDSDLTWTNDGTAKPTATSVTTTTNKAPKIGRIGSGNTFSSTTNTIYNLGEITMIGGEESTAIEAAANTDYDSAEIAVTGGEESTAIEAAANTDYGSGEIAVTGGEESAAIEAAANTDYDSGEIAVTGGEKRTIIEATTGVAVYNYRGLGVSTEGVSTNVPAHIGTIGKVSVSAATYGIQNGDGNASYVGVTIDEIGEGAEITATGNHAVYNFNANSVIKTITGGIFTTASNDAKVYALYNNSTTTPILITGGDFKSGSNDRAHAIYLPDNTDRYTYPDGMSLREATRDVTFADGESGKNYYYIAGNSFYIIFDGNGATEGKMEKQTISLDDPNAEVSLTPNTFVFTLDGEPLGFLGWATVKESSETKLDDGWTGTVQALKELLEKAPDIDDIQAGTEITLYAVWNAEDPSTYEIVWGDLDFIYTRPGYTWNPDQLKYVQTNADEAGWSAAGESEPTITVKVEGDASYEAKLNYSNEDGFKFDMTFTGRGDVEVTDNTFTIPGNGEAVVEAMLTGEPDDEAMLTGEPDDGLAEKIQVGTVTIELTKQEPQQTP